MILFICFLVLGLVLLLLGSELLVKKAHFLAEKFSVSPFVIGAFLLGMGTSAPEWAVSALSSLKGLSSLAIANVFGSNIFNILLVLGLVLFKPLSLGLSAEIRKNIFFLVSFGFLLIPVLANRFFSRWEAFVLLGVFTAYIVFIWRSKNLSPMPLKENSPAKTINDSADKNSFFNNSSLFWDICRLLMGFILLIGGSYLAVYGAEGLAHKTGMSERLIGILIVSTGTGLPELVTSSIALIRGYKSIAFGNIIGSNIFNTFAILGTAGLIQPMNVDFNLLFLDLPVLMFVHTALLLIVFSMNKPLFQKILPFLFLGGYIVYTAVLIILR